MRIIISIFIISLFSASAISQKKADLSFQLEMNRVYRVKSTSIQNTTQSVMGNEQSVQTNNISVISLKPLKLMDGEMIAEIRFDTIITETSQPQMEINSSRPGDLNSGDPGKVIECILNRMSNSTFLAKMTNTGRVVQFMNLEPVVNGIRQGIDSIQGPTASFIIDRVNSMLEEKALKAMVESVTVYLPGKEVRAGDKWEISLAISAGGMNFNQKGNYTLESLEKKSAVISAEVITESLPGTMEISGVQITPDIRGLGKTELTIDPATGWIISGTVKQQLKGEMAVNAQGNALTIPVEISTDIELVALDGPEE